MVTVVVIPCRWNSRRLPGKPLLPVLNKPLIQRVYERAARCRKASRVVVATDDARVERAVRDFGGEVIRTGSGPRTGSDRVAAVMKRLPADAYVNLQGDELILEPEILDELIARFERVRPREIGTLKQPIGDFREVINPNVVKVVTDRSGNALYFSRSPIPYVRVDGRASGRAVFSPKAFRAGTYFKHFGIYIYGRRALAAFAKSRTGLLEDREKLEQLRALETGIRIRVWETRRASLRIDTREDLKRAERALRKAGGDD
jgi:3-deoxy-manno-octulosonate cytidylyltransferase (CMP-KDO synthetase)